MIAAHLVALNPPPVLPAECTGFFPELTKPTQRYGAGDPFCVAEERKADRIRAGVV